MTRTLNSPHLEKKLKREGVKDGPRFFKVIMHNDDYTTMDFVIEMLESIFHKKSAEATSLMLQIHRRGKALCGLYPFEIAETKVDKVHKQARAAGFPLRCSLESE